MDYFNSDINKCSSLKMNNCNFFNSNGLFNIYFTYLIIDNCK